METAIKEHNGSNTHNVEIPNTAEIASAENEYKNLGSIDYAENFYAESIQEGPSPAPLVSSDKDGLINVILLSGEVSESLQDLLNEQKQNLINLTGLATAYVSRKSQGDPNKKYDVQLWQQVFNNLPLMGPSKFSKQKFSKRVRGIEIAKTFMDFILSSVVDKRPAMDEFRKFIENQGTSIKIGTEKNQDGFQMGTICIVLETMQVGNEIQLVPKLKAYFVKFNRRNFTFSGACAKYEEVDIEFTYETAVGVFNYKALENSKVKEKFNALIGKAQIEDLTQSGNFFSDDIEQKSHDEKISDAEGFYPPVNNQESVLDWNSLDKERLIKIIQSEPNVTGELQKILHKQKQYLLDLVGMAAGYIHKKCSVNPLAIYDVKLWQETLSKLPLMNDFKFREQSFSYQVTPAIANVLLAKKSGFIGGAISLLIEPQKLGLKIDLLPKIKTYFLFLEEEEMKKIISVFRTGEETAITFKSLEATSLFNYKALEKDSNLKEKFEGILNKVFKLNVTTWDNFFSEKYSAYQLTKKHILGLLNKETEAPAHLGSIVDEHRQELQDIVKNDYFLKSNTNDMTESSGNSNLEAIVLKVGRPVLFIQGNTFSTPVSNIWRKRLEDSRTLIESVIKSVGRIELRNSTFDWVGTGWLVAPGILVTNRHVANSFATKGSDKFVFRVNGNGETMRASINFKAEYDSPAATELQIEEILHIEEDKRLKDGSQSPDIAFLKVSKDHPFNPITLSKNVVKEDTNVVVIGYPARDSRNDYQVMDRIFDGVYNVKRLHPGQITTVTNNVIKHDCSTLGGNSGSVVLDIETGEAVGLHYGGRYQISNYAVPSPIIIDRLKKINITI